MTQQVTRIVGETATSIYNLLKLPGAHRPEGPVVTVRTSPDRFAVTAATSEAFAQLNIVPSRQMVSFAVADIALGQLMVKAVDDAPAVTLYTQNWSRQEGAQGAPSFIIPANPKQLATDLVTLADRITSILSPAPGPA